MFKQVAENNSTTRQNLKIIIISFVFFYAYISIKISVEGKICLRIGVEPAIFRFSTPKNCTY